MTRVARLLHEFDPDTEGTPTAAPVADADGTFVGATSNNRTFGVNVVYRVSLAGAFSIVAPLDFFDEGYGPNGTLLRAADGRFYGATAQGGGAH